MLHYHGFENLNPSPQKRLQKLHNAGIRHPYDLVTMSGKAIAKNAGIRVGLINKWQAQVLNFCILEKTPIIFKGEDNGLID